MAITVGIGGLLPLVVVGGTALAQPIGPHAYQAMSASGGTFELPTVIRVRPGTMRILRPRCDSSYPMDESMPCGTATGGPVGGRGS